MMSTERLVSLRNPWFVVSVGATLALLIFAALVGFIWLPSAQKDAQFQGVWQAICSAAGVPRAWYAGVPVQSSVQTSTVVVTPQLLDHAPALSVGRGATLSMRCTMCHGARGVSDAITPNLAGQYAEVIYKQIEDFRSGARISNIMRPMVADLSDQDIRDLAAYYAYLPRVVRVHDGSGAPAIVMNGAPMRNIAPCASCHGGLDHKAASPWLDGLAQPYLRAQLQAFASGARHNDISGQMRNVARNMTPEEIDAATRYYSQRAPTP
jgi:cytochrome c553